MIIMSFWRFVLYGYVLFSSLLKILSFKLLCTILFSCVYPVVACMQVQRDLDYLNSTVWLTLVLEYFVNIIREFCQHYLLCGALLSLGTDWSWRRGFQSAHLKNHDQQSNRSKAVAWKAAIIWQFAYICRTLPFNALNLL